MVIRLFQERVEGLSDPIDPGFGFDLIRLEVPLIEPLAAAQLKLEGGTAGEVQVAALIDRLSTRLGRGRVRRFVAIDTHIPEQAQLALPAVEAALARGGLARFRRRRAAGAAAASVRSAPADRGDRRGARRPAAPLSLAARVA